VNSERDLGRIPIGSADRDGRFELKNVLEGTYDFQFDVFNHFTLRQTVTTIEGDTTIRFEAKPAN